MSGAGLDLGCLPEVTAALAGRAEHDRAGLTRKYPLERHYRDVLCTRVHTPQDDSVVAAAGQSALASAGPSRTLST
jgi:alkylation response protein AidB-like acyl-CoA dehydrogenase